MVTLLNAILALVVGVQRVNTLSAVRRPAAVPQVVHEGTPAGRFETITGINMYITKPRRQSIEPRRSKPSVGILYLSDVLGLALPQNLLLADSFANAGYLVVAPDLFQGHPAPDDVDRPDLGFVALDFLNAHPPNITDPIIAAAVRYLREDLGVNRIGVTGYCFGGRYGFRFATSEKHADGLGLDVVAAAHPTFLSDEEIVARDAPATIATAQTDFLMPTERRWEVETALLSTTVPSELALYSGVHHGFGIRANISDPVARFAKEAAFHQAIQWFYQWL